MKVTFLGTGTSQGVPVIACQCSVCTSTDPLDKRLRSSVLIEDKGFTFVIDAGPDFRQQMLSSKVLSLDFVLLTHEHRDHIAGLDDIRSFNWLSQNPMDIYAENRVLEAVKHEYNYVFSEFKYPGIPEMNLISIENNPFMINGIEIIPIRGFHHKLPVFGYKIHQFAYLTDMNQIPESECEKLQNLDVLVINALRIEPHISHFNLEQALEIIEKVKPKQAYLTHISHLLGFNKEVSKQLPKNVSLAYDRLSLSL